MWSDVRSSAITENNNKLALMHSVCCLQRNKPTTSVSLMLEKGPKTKSWEDHGEPEPLTHREPKDFTKGTFTKQGSQPEEQVPEEMPKIRVKTSVFLVSAY